MAEYLLNVPLVGQKNGYDEKPLMQPDRFGEISPHGFMACWYASACMVSYYYRAGPRLGLPTVWKKDRGLSVEAINQLANVEGLTPIEKPKVRLTVEGILELLMNYGPIWAAGYYLDDAPKQAHAIVLTGVQDLYVHYNDPWEPKAKKNFAEWIESKLLPFPNALLVKDKNSY